MDLGDLGLEPDSSGCAGAGRIAGQPVRYDQAVAVHNPADGSTVATVGWATPEQVGRSVEAATTAGAEWSRVDLRERARALRAIAGDLRSRTEALGDLICAETGKRLEEARAEVGFSARYFDWFADATTRLQHSTAYATPVRRFRVEAEPVGVVAAISPWNFPLSIPARKLAPALAAGCAVVQKPSELAPLSSLALDALCAHRLPAGTVNTVLGDAGATTCLLDEPAVRLASFTGSTPVGRAVATRCAARFTRTILELGGRAPFIVCEDADLQTTVDALLVAKLRNNGESCLAANNVLIHRSRLEEVVDSLRDRLAGITIGDPRDPATELGPLIRDSEPERLASMVDRARQAGADVAQFGEGQVAAGSCYSAVSVVEGPPEDAEAWSTEVFGPVFSIRGFEDEDEMVAGVNRWGTGLGGYVLTEDPERQATLADALDVGIVGVNNGAPNTPEVPFGGRGESGLGYEGGLSGLREFTSMKTISTAR